jgi:hypothetical protein
MFHVQVRHCKCSAEVEGGLTFPEVEVCEHGDLESAIPREPKGIISAGPTCFMINRPQFHLEDVRKWLDGEGGRKKKKKKKSYLEY